jgi:hypothetical protein
MTTETERTALVERHAIALMDDGSPSGPDECRYVTLAMARSAIAAAVTAALASAPSAPQPTTTCEGGVTVRWCPRCGTCTCPALTGAETDWPEDPFCPIHGTRSTHEEPSTPPSDDPDPLMQELYDAIEAMPYAGYISSEDASFPDRLIAIVKLHSEVPKEPPSSHSQGQERTALIDPIAAAVDAHLDPLKDELIAMGRKLAKVDESAYCTEDHGDGWCCTLLKGHTGDHIATNEHESNSENVKGRVYARWSGEVTR